jgi:hypothetical protein
MAFSYVPIIWQAVIDCQAVSPEAEPGSQIVEKALCARGVSSLQNFRKNLMRRAGFLCFFHHGSRRIAPFSNLGDA